MAVDLFLCEANEVVFSINVVVNNRPESLKRLLNSIKANDFSKDTQLTFHLEAMQSKEIHDIVESFEWSGGHIHKRARITKGGLIAAVVESWSPPKPSQKEFSVLLEDDIVLAPTAREWLEKTLPWCADDPICAGVSLYTPRIHELTRSRPRRDKLLKSLPSIYGQQLPCSWGAAFKSEHWSYFRLWMEHRLSVKSFTMPYVLDMGLMSGWENSWKKFYTEVTLLRGWYLLYPNFKNQTSFSTNMLEVGEHIKKGGVHKAEDYNLPLAEILPYFEFPRRLQILDSMDYHVPALPKPGAKEAMRFIKLPSDQHLSRKGMTEVCKRYDSALHQKMIHFGNESQTTLVISHFIRTAKYSSKRPWMRDMLEHYCSMSVVHRIVVVWHNSKVALPRKLMCPNGITSIVFTRGDGRNRLMNRFYPTALITTPSVTTIDDDIFVDRADLENMVHIWLKNRKSVVGPFARFYTNESEYTYKPDKAQYVGYPIILTKVHVSAQSLFRDVYCRTGYSKMRDFVNKHTNCEDLLYIRAARDGNKDSRTGAPVIKYVPKCPVIDLGQKGLHRRKKHEEQRSQALNRFGLIDPAGWQTVEYSFQDVDKPVQYLHDKKKVEISLSDYHGTKKQFPMCFENAMVPLK